ncbi:MAG: hypothetical protein V7L11_12970 [Nostoc sp.]|uniref:hypothetical protein n=1 Tax=Nostoc sp. TaxID=1180 RepID=UPI002FFD39E2
MCHSWLLLGKCLQIKYHTEQDVPMEFLIYSSSRLDTTYSQFKPWRLEIAAT